MRSCLLGLILLALVAANGYTIWQVRSMRAALEELRAGNDAGEQGEGLSSLAEYARDAAEAVGRGETERAAEDLRRLQEMLAVTKEAAGERRGQITSQVRAAQEALSQGREDARAQIERLVSLLSPRERSEDRELD